MALTSPGVEVSVIDQSQYLPAPTTSVPLIIMATAQNKADPTGSGIAQATSAANAGKLYQVTSQRDLVTLFGSPFFYTTSTGTPIQGYELNEYGLLAAYSVLGVTNRCYVLRADIDLASLVGQTGRPTGAPEDGSYWLDTTNSTWGIYEFDSVSGKFNIQRPIVITEASKLTNGVPLQSIGNIGDYAVNAIQITSGPASNPGQYFFKTPSNTWVKIGAAAWKNAWPTVLGSESYPTLTVGDTFTLNLNGSFSATITVPDDGGGSGSASGVATAINALGWSAVSAGVTDGKLNIYSSQPESLTSKFLIIGGGIGNVLSDLGINAQVYYPPVMTFGTSSQQPLWQTGQATPRPTGSVWVKVGSASTGMTPVLSKYSSALAAWQNKNVVMAASDWKASAMIAPMSASSIPEGTIYGEYSFDGNFQFPLYLWERISTGPTVVTGTAANPQFTDGPYTFNVYVSTPGNTELTGPIPVYLLDNSNNAQFVTSWAAASIPFTTASVTDGGFIQLVHTEGGEIIIDDTITSGVDKGKSSGLCVAAGFTTGVTDGCKYGFSPTVIFNDVVQTATSGVGTNLQISVTVSNAAFQVNPTAFSSAGTGYVVGDTVTFPGTSFGGTTPANNIVVRVASTGAGGSVTGVAFVSGTSPLIYTTQLSNWRMFNYISNEGAPVSIPANNTNWFYSVVDEVDIMVNYNGNWKGYKNQNYDVNGFPTPTGSNATNTSGPIISASEPSTQNDGSPLEYGDLWVSTADLENYPVIYRWQQVDAVNQWVLIDNTDSENSNGIVFADARWATSGSVNPADDQIPSITSLLTSNYLDLDAPAASLYPVGTLLFNTRRSGYNVKQYKVNYFNNSNFPGETLPAQADAWVSVSGLNSNGAPFMGRKAQRAVVVQALRSVTDTNLAIRDEDNFFNLMAAPGYPELQPNMVVLNSDRGETAYIVGDTPLGLSDSATDIQAWATNAAGATSTGEDGCVTRNTYLGLYYPSGIAADLSGNLVTVPASHMMLRTFLRNDTVSYPWLAAAGTRRGIIDNATNIGYINRQTGEFQAIKTRVGIRDVLYTNFINPLVFFTGNGLLNYGNKSSFNSSSALDRTNVARLVAHIRRQLTLAARPYVFEPNDGFTRGQIAGTIETLMLDLVAKRGIYDYLVVCDDSNNTPARIDRSELWVDVAIEPVKAAEFIYVPIRILNTGELKNQ